MDVGQSTTAGSSIAIGVGVGVGVGVFVLALGLAFSLSADSTVSLASWQLLGGSGLSDTNVLAVLASGSGRGLALAGSGRAGVLGGALGEALEIVLLLNLTETDLKVKISAP